MTAAQKKPLCIYHGKCDDGFGAAYAIWKKYGNGVEYYPGVYQAQPPDVYHRVVFIVDFSYKRPVMERICRRASSVTILDHHVTAKDDLEGLDKWAAEQGLSVDLEFDMERSGAMMSWQHFHPGVAPPRLIEYIQDRDLFRKALPGGDQFTIALRAYPQDFLVWNGFDVEALIAEGDPMLRYYRTQVEALKSSAWKSRLAGYDIPIVNAPYAFASEVAGELAEGEPFAACFFIVDAFMNFSLRSRPGMVDVSEIAKKFGGGGHKHAAGFRVKVEDAETIGDA